MKKDQFTMLLEEVRGLRSDFKELRQEVKEVRQSDIPQIKTEVAVVKSETGREMRIITAVGGLVAVATSAAIAWFK